MPMYPNNMSIIDLVSNPTAHVTGAAGVRLRNNAGVLQASQDGGAYRRLEAKDVFHVEDYGASTALADNSAAFQAAINAAGAVGGTVMIPAGTWKILSELLLSARVNVVGAGMDHTFIRADAPMRSVLFVYFTVAAGTTELTQLTLDGNSNATSAMYCLTAAFMRSTAVRFRHAIKDGVRLAGGSGINYVSGTGGWSVGQTVTGGTSGATGVIAVINGTTSGSIVFEGRPIGTFLTGEDLKTLDITRAVADGSTYNATANDKLHFQDCWMERNGTMYRTTGIGIINQNCGADVVTPGTVSTTATSTTVTGVGTVFTQMGIRHGDIIRVGALVTRLNYVSGTDGWSAGQTVTGGTSGAAGVITEINGTTSGYIAFAGSVGAFVSGEDLKTLGVTRAVSSGVTYHAPGASMEFLMAETVVSDTVLTLASISPAAQTRSTQPFAVGVGDGYHEDSSPENNINSITGGLIRGNSGAQMFFNGLYGPRVAHVQIDYVPSYGIIVNDGSNKTVYTSSFDHLYFESVLGGAFFLSAAAGITINSALTAMTGSAYDGVVTTAPPRWRVTNDSRVGGVWLGGAAIGTDDAIEAVGGALCKMDVVQSANQKRFAVRGPFQLVQDTGTLVAGTAIAPTRAHHRFSIAGNVTMTATPTINIPGAGEGVGDILALTNESNFTLTLQDVSVLPGSGLRLGAPTRTIGPGKCMFLILQGDNQWHHLLTTEEGAETLASGIVSHQFGFGTPAIDNSGTAGATTINKCNGRAAIATGASTVTVTNSFVAAVDTVVVTALARLSQFELKKGYF